MTRRIAAPVFLGVWSLLCLGVVWLALPRDTWPTIRVRFVNATAVERLGMFGYVIYDLGDTIGRKWRQGDLAALDPTPYRAYLQGIAASRPAPPPSGRKKKHVVYLQMEGVDGLVIGAQKNGRALMPFLDRLAAQNIYFSNTIDNTASGRTTDAEFLVLTSEVPLRRPPVFVSQQLDLIPSMPKVLRAAGYRTASIHGFNGTFWRRAYAHEALGYEENYYEDHFKNAERIGWGVSDRAVLQESARIIAESPVPLFLHIILLTNHHPFTYYGEHVGKPQATIEASCVQSVGYVDECIAGFFGELQRRGKLDDCIIAIYSDHDSAITDRLERYLDRVPVRKLSDTVPLIVTGLSHGPARVEEVTGLQDLPVIVLEELGLPVPLTFTGNGFGRFGATVGAMHGALRGTKQGVEPFVLPVTREELTMLSLYHPEELQGP
jgi:hypothetical protein